MFCVNCGSKLDDNSEVCLRCGKLVKTPVIPPPMPGNPPMYGYPPMPGYPPMTPLPPVQPVIERDGKPNAFAIVGFILSILSILVLFFIGTLVRTMSAMSIMPLILLPVGAIAFSAFGFSQVKKRGGFGFSLAGVIIGGLVLIVFGPIYLIMVIVFSAFGG